MDENRRGQVEGNVKQESSGRDNWKDGEFGGKVET